MKYDYIVIGFGIAGMTITFQLLREGKTVLVIDGNTTKASHVAAGMYNPVILKRFTLAWHATELMEYAAVFYNDLGVFLEVKTTEDLPVYRKFYSVEEQNNWFAAIDNPSLSNYMSPYLKKEASKVIDAPFKYGEVKKTGRLLVKNVFSQFKTKLEKENGFVVGEVDFNTIQIEKNTIQINGYSCNKLIFCEGYGMQANPYFNYLPLVGNRGAYLIIKSTDLDLKVAIKSQYFLIPLGGDLYKFGATYPNHKQIRKVADADFEKHTLETAFKKLTDASYSIIDFVAAIRPTVKDRRPLLGMHPKYKNMFVFNGLGTRGVTLAPKNSQMLIDFLERDVALASEINIKRYETFYDQI